ncbi:MAG: hypothetical protein U1E47_05270 [Rivihabitans pingtungensis]
MKLFVSLMPAICLNSCREQEKLAMLYFRGLLKYKIRSKFNEKIFDLLLLHNPCSSFTSPPCSTGLKPQSQRLAVMAALLLSPVLWANDEEMRHKTAY